MYRLSTVSRCILSRKKPPMSTFSCLKIAISNLRKISKTKSGFWVSKWRLDYRESWKMRRSDKWVREKPNRREEGPL